MKHNYQDTITWKQVVLIQDLTYEFVELFKVEVFRADHMKRSARSEKQNLAEGATRNSVKDYIQFIGFDRASAEELLEDYRDITKNLLIDLVIRTNYLLDQQRRGLEKSFIEQGGYTENLAKKRQDYRGF